MKNKNNHTLAAFSLKRKLNVAFALMSIIPLLVLGYLVSTYVIPKTHVKIDVILSILISVFIAVIGFFVIKEVFDRIVSVTSEAKLIAAGDISRKLEIENPDEVGDLGNSLNQLTQRIRSNMDELKSYGEKTTEINFQIQKRVIVLSSLLQISSLISQGAKLEDILQLIVEKARLLANSDASYLLFRDEGRDLFSLKAADGINSAYLLKVTVDPSQEIFQKLVKTNSPLVLDKETLAPEAQTALFYDKFKLKNTLALPVFFKGRVNAVLGIGNSKETFLYAREDVEMLDIFAKQIAIAIENDLLMHRVEKLEIKDALTGLYNEAFIKNRLQEEIKRAIIYQRPCAFILFDIDNFKNYHDKFGYMHSESVLKKIGSLIRDSVTEIDRVGRVGEDEFAIILPERNKRQAQEIAENIRKKIQFSYSEEADEAKKVTVSAGVSENPLDGIEAEELVAKAKDLRNMAKKQGRNRVVSF